MKILTPGHRYELANHENKNSEGQILQFIEKKPLPPSTVMVEGSPPQLITVNDGTTNEEVLAVLIDRMKFLYEKLPSVQTKAAIVCCEEALSWLEKRTRDRLARGVENTPKA